MIENEANFTSFKRKYRHVSLITVVCSCNYSLWSPEDRNTHILQNLNEEINKTSEAQQTNETLTTPFFLLLQV